MLLYILQTMNGVIQTAQCVHSLPLSHMKKVVEKCLTPGLYWARNRLQIPADDCSASTFHVWHLNGMVLMRKRISLGPPSPVFSVVVWHQLLQWHTTFWDALPLPRPLIISVELLELAWQNFYQALGVLDVARNLFKHVFYIFSCPLKICLHCDIFKNLC